MGKLFDDTTTQAHLFYAWRKIRENGYRSILEETRTSVELFDQEANKNIIRIQRLLRTGEFQFLPQTGVAKTKKSGGKRGIVMAPLQNRIVERALLNTLQTKSSFIDSVISMPTSVGGVPDRSVPHGLKIIKNAIDDGYKYFVRSDISGFFDHIPRQSVLQKISADITDDKFLKLLDEATLVSLENEQSLGEDRKIFPTDEEGVAQGSPLSPLFGNILLYDFDRQFNDRGIICVRFIDDFVLLAKDEKKTIKAFENAKKHLSALNLRCHDPFEGAVIDKADSGCIDSGFVFLGYDIRPGLFQPSLKAREQLLKAVRDKITVGKRNIMDIKSEPHSHNTQRYAQTLVSIDRIIRGWGNSFSYGNSASTLIDLDTRLNEELNKFQNWHDGIIRNLNSDNRRRLTGVCLLSDITTKNIDEAPFKIKCGPKFYRSKKTITISTDGSVIGSRRHGKDRGPGGWAYIVHEPRAENCGNEDNTTNNQMELRAVIEAVKSTPLKSTVIIRTDSQYVDMLANGNGVVNSNMQMWLEYQDALKDRNVRVVWVKGHNGDQFNERADILAKEQSNFAQKYAERF